MSSVTSCSSLIALALSLLVRDAFVVPAIFLLVLRAVVGAVAAFVRAVLDAVSSVAVAVAVALLLLLLLPRLGQYDYYMRSYERYRSGIGHSCFCCCCAVAAAFTTTARII